MRLKRLELYGYKSFASRTVFEFGEGVTAVVGPNGSGKSNVADAIRWVMGEQSYRTLRAQTSEDMIFAGSGRRARLGMAEVTVTLDNNDGWLPIDYSEVTIGRRAHRSGENEYLLNGQRVRYRDIVDLLESGGLARTSYTVLGQGMVDAALALRPEARRVLFEDAAGIAPLLRKREEALERIAETERNLQRVADILSEIQPRAARLRRQAERAEEYMVLSHDLQELQRIWFGHQWQLRTRSLSQSVERVKKSQQRVVAQSAYTREVEARIAALGEEQAGLRAQAEALSAQQLSLRTDSESRRRELAVVSERLKLYAQQADTLETEEAGFASRRAIVRAEIERATAELGEQEQTANASRTELEAARAELALANQTRAERERQSAALQVRLNQSVSQVADQRARLEQTRERRTALLADRERAQVALVDLGKRAEASASESKALSEREQSLAEQLAGNEAQQAEVNNQLVGARAASAAAEGQVRARRAELERLVARRDLVGRLRQDLTGYYPGVREVLGARSGLRGLLGTVASLMDVPAELEQAIESALGPRLQHVVAECWEDAEQAIAHLKRTRAGWATFLPMDTVRTRPALEVAAKGRVRGVASRLVRTRAELQPVVDLLLGTTLVVEDLPTARGLLNQRGISLIVTLDGETVQPSGALSGGARHQGTNLLAQEREWRDLPVLVEGAESELAAAQAQLDACEGVVQQLEHQLADKERHRSELTSERERARARIALQAQAARELTRDQQWQSSHMEQATRELGSLAEREKSIQGALAEAQEQQMALSAELRELREGLEGGKDETLRRRAAELETRVAVAERTVQSQRALVNSHKSGLAQLEEQAASKSAQRAGLLTTIAALRNEVEEAQKQGQGVEDAIAALVAQLAPLHSALAKLDEQQAEVEHQRMLAQERMNEAELNYNRAVLECEHADGEQQSLARTIEEELGPVQLPEIKAQQLHLTLGDDVVVLPTVESLPPGLSNEIRDLKARLRRLGGINPDAPREYEQLLDRETFLQGQDADLRGAIASLHEVITELDARIDREFTSTFKAVTKAFSEYFQTLFAGGRAKLVLTDPEVISSTGVDIEVHLPGKRTESLALLSGGERALTAVALLFALLKANPVPFCFLDEVDAMLDEVNVRRFRQVLEEHARHTQFVVITHNRYTMESATTIYGISMSEQGVSQSVSLDLARDAERIKGLRAQA